MGFTSLWGTRHKYIGLIHISGGGLPPLWERSPFKNGGYALHSQACQGLLNKNLSTKGMSQVGPKAFKRTQAIAIAHFPTRTDW